MHSTWHKLKVIAPSGAVTSLKEIVTSLHVNESQQVTHESQTENQSGGDSRQMLLLAFNFYNDRIPPAGYAAECTTNVQAGLNLSARRWRK